MKKKEFIWNTIGSTVYSLFNSIMLMFCTRLNGVEIAGIFSICYATGCILNSIGDWGIRIYQVTDTKRKFKFIDYFFSRVVTIIIMLIFSVIFLIFNNYSNEKFYIFVILIFVRVVDNFSETFQAEFQLNNRLDVAGKVLLVRNLVEIFVFVVVDFITKNIYVSFGAMLLASILMLLIFDVRLTRKNTELLKKIELKNVKKITIECFPLAISTIVSMYVINVVKYAIDMNGNNTLQTYFNILYIPTFAINLISMLIIKNFLKVFGEYWNNKEYKKFIKIILYISLLLVVSTFAIEVVCFFIGIPILNFVYGVNLENYKIDLLILILSGLFYAISNVLFYAVSTIRKQKSSTIVFIITVIFSTLISNILVSKYEMTGAVMASVLTMMFLTLGMGTAFGYGFIKQKNSINKNI